MNILLKKKHEFSPHFFRVRARFQEIVNLGNQNGQFGGQHPLLPHFCPQSRFFHPGLPEPNEEALLEGEDSVSGASTKQSNPFFSSLQNYEPFLEKSQHFDYSLSDVEIEEL